MTFDVFQQVVEHAERALLDNGIAEEIGETVRQSMEAFSLETTIGNGMLISLLAVHNAIVADTADLCQGRRLER